MYESLRIARVIIICLCVFLFCSCFEFRCSTTLLRLFKRIEHPLRRFSQRELKSHNHWGRVWLAKTSRFVHVHTNCAVRKRQNGCSFNIAFLYSLRFGVLRDRLKESKSFVRPTHYCIIYVVHSLCHSLHRRKALCMHSRYNRQNNLWCWTKANTDIHIWDNNNSARGWE